MFVILPARLGLLGPGHCSIFLSLGTPFTADAADTADGNVTISRSGNRHPLLTVSHRIRYMPRVPFPSVSDAGSCKYTARNAWAVELASRRPRVCPCSCIYSDESSAAQGGKREGVGGRVRERNEFSLLLKVELPPSAPPPGRVSTPSLHPPVALLTLPLSFRRFPELPSLRACLRAAAALPLPHPCHVLPRLPGLARLALLDCCKLLRHSQIS